MIDYLLQYVPLNGYIAILLYWVPMGLCIVGYTARTWRHYRDDLAKRASDQHYYPTDTLGSLIGRAFVTICPIANLWAAMFDVGPQLFSKFFAVIGKVFDQPIVPKRKEKP